MDMSMEDLFCDFDRSSVLIESEHKLDKNLSRNCTILLNEVVGTQIFQVKAFAQHSLNKYLLEFQWTYDSIMLSKNLIIFVNSLEQFQSSMKSCILCHQSAVSKYFPTYNSSIIEKQPVLPILICSNYNFILSFISPNCDWNEESKPLPVWLVGFNSNECSTITIYAFCYPMRMDNDNASGNLWCKRAFQLPFYQAILVNLSVLHNPVQLDLPLSSHSTSIQPNENSINDILIILTQIGEGFCIWQTNSSSSFVQTKTFNFTEFHLPPLLQSTFICSSNTQGSWFHVITSSGHLMSVHFSIRALKLKDVDQSFRWELVCKPANFPRLPIELAPVDCFEHWEKSYPTWRDLNISHFTRLSDSHLGCIHFDGHKSRLVELLSSQTNQTLISVCDSYNLEKLQTDYDRLSKSHIDLIQDEKMIRVYLACVQLIRMLNDHLKNVNNNKIFNSKVYLKLRNESDCVCKLSLPPNELIFELCVDIDMIFQTKLTSHCSSKVLFDPKWKSLNMEDLIWILLVSKNDLFIMESLKPYLYLDVIVSPKWDDYQPNEMSYSNVYRYKEQWFSFINMNNQSDKHHVIIPSNWYRLIRKSYCQAGTPDFIEIQITLQFDYPTLTKSVSYLDCEPNHKKTNFKQVQSFDSYVVFPICAKIGCHSIDSIDLFYPITNLILDTSNDSTNSEHMVADTLSKFLPQLSMHSLVSYTILKGILSDALKFSSNTCHSPNNRTEIGHFLSKNNKAVFIFCFTNTKIELKWKVNCTNFGGDGDENNNRFPCVFTSTCPKILWLIHTAIKRRMSVESKTNNRDESIRTCVEELRKEYCLLNKLSNSLRQLKMLDASSDNESKSGSNILNKLLDTYCILRNSKTTNLFNH